MDQIFSEEMDIRIQVVNCKKEMEQFILFPRELYKSDRNFIFEPISLQKEFFSEKNPFFKHSSARFFIAMSDDRVVGRIASIVNTVHNEVYHEKIGFFGFFEVVEHYEVVKQLLDAVVNAHRKSGFEIISGPTNFTTNDSCGMLLSGFDKPPVVMMPYNKAYYNRFLDQYGFRKETDLSSYFLDDKILASPAFTKIVERIKRKLDAKGIVIRNINYKDLDNELISACEVYNQSNKDNYGFIPLTQEEFRHTGQQFRQFVPEDMLLLAEKDKQLIGFQASIPDLNLVFSHIRSGRLYPFGFLKYLWYKRKVKSARILILGVIEEYRNMGIDIVLYKTNQENLAQRGIHQVEAGYVMENNHKMHSILRKIGAKKIKEYRMYRLDLTADSTEHYIGT